MTHYTYILFLSSWFWVSGALYLGSRRTPYPTTFASIFGFFGTIGFFASARFLNEGRPILISFSLLDFAIFLYVIGCPALLYIIVKSWNENEQSDSNLP